MGTKIHSLKPKSWEHTLLLALSTACLLVGVIGAGFVLVSLSGETPNRASATLATLGICIASGLLGMAAFFRSRKSVSQKV